ncbi:serine/threonine-protein kinase [Planctomycetota bacterium]|nr:serine/threonine-protein kinase [Planctomycetota bacterium]
MPRLLVEKGPDRGKSVSLTAGKPLIAGRDAAVDLQLSDTMASRRHFKVANKGEQWGLVDLKSANGTLVNGKTSDGAVRLQIGDSVQVGETLISFLAEEKDDRSGLIGQQIGGYLIEKRLGRGAMGTVYKAMQLSLNRTIALKVLSPDLVKDEKFCQMFVKEARAAGGLNHPNIVQVYDVGDEGGHYFFSMEYASNGSVLEEMGKGGALELGRALSVIKQTCAALDYGERKGLVHRDIKPDNLMVMEDGSVKLGDLGLAMSGQEREAEQDGVFGTPHYIAPEQAMGKPVDHRADIYALGATFYRMVSGQTLYTGTTVKEILKKQVREPHDPITLHVPDCPQAISNIIDRMLAKEPSERYQHGSDILNDIANFEALSTRQSSVMSSTFGERPSGIAAHQSQQIAEMKAKRNLTVAIVAAVFAVAAAGLSLYFFVFSSPPPAHNNSVATANTQPDSNNPPDNGSSDGPGLAPEVKRANEALKTALIQAGAHADVGTLQGLERAIDLLGNALPKWSRAEKAVKKKVSDKIAAYTKLLDERRGDPDQLRSEWEEVIRNVAALLEEFKYEEAKALVISFRDGLQDQKNAAAKDLLDSVNDYLSVGLPNDVQRHLSQFIQNCKAERRKTDGQGASERLPKIVLLVKKVEDAETKCDHEDSKKQLKALKDEFIKLRKQLENAVKSGETQAKEIAYNRALVKLENALAGVRGHVALGQFIAAEKALKEFETGCPEFVSYGKDPLFAPIVKDIRLRREQSEYEQAGIRALSQANKWIPRMSALLKSNPWPSEFAALVGGADYIIQFKIESRSESMWYLNIYNPADISHPERKDASDFNTPAMRKALGEAIGHVLLNTEALVELDEPIERDGPSALVGLFAWMAELGANREAYDVIKYRYNKVKEGDADYIVTREYYAYGMLAMIMHFNSSGNKSGAEALLKEFDAYFKDTRAAESLK